MTCLLWLRRDLRSTDLPALAAAAAGGEVLPVFVVDPALWQSCGANPRGWVAANVLALRLPVVVRTGRPADVLRRLADEVGADQIHLSAETTPYGRRRDQRVRERLSDVEWHATGSPYAVGPELVRKRDGEPYQVFTPYAKAWRTHGWAAPAENCEVAWAEAGSDPRAVEMLHEAVAGARVPLPRPGETAALSRWHDFLDRIDDYANARDRPDLAATSTLSPYLKVGAIHPRTLLADLATIDSAGADAFRAELAWREFYADVLWHHPHSAWRDLRAELAHLAYDDLDDETLAAWREGRTGFPIVDAGLRQLRETGWMHNRVRMIVASFFAKDLHAWWPIGARHFLDELIDADIASNSHGWQWCAGTGTDASPYFRVFNPESQALKFDPDGAYVRRWVPEVATPAYPPPLVDHAQERRVALARYGQARGR